MMRRLNFTPIRGGRLALLSIFLLVIAELGWSQSAGERDHFQLRIGAAYDQGDFGSSETTKVLFAPITLRYLGERFDLSVTPSFARVNSIGGVRLVDGVPTPTGETTSIRDTRSTAGDTVIRGRYYLLEEETLNVSPFAKIKIPTAPADSELGTGRADYGFGVEVDKVVTPSVLVFGDLSYTFIGNIPEVNLRNRVGGSLGVGRSLSDRVFVSGMLDWRQALVEGNPDPTDLVGVITFRPKPAVAISPHTYIGLTDSSPDFGVGIELSVRFGRH